MPHPKQNQSFDSVGAFPRTGASSSNVQNKYISLGKWDGKAETNKEVSHQTPQGRRKVS